MAYTRHLQTALLALLATTGCAPLKKSLSEVFEPSHRDVLIIGPSEYKLTTTGAGMHSQEEVEHAFLKRASEVCKGAEFKHNFKSEPYQYMSSGGGYSFRHDAFKTTGTVKCEPPND